MLIVDVVFTCGAQFEGNPPSSYLVFSTNEKHRYCPVFEKTRWPHKQYLHPNQYRPSLTTVAKSSVLYSASYEGVSASFEWKPVDGWNTKDPFMIKRRVSETEERKKNFLQEFDKGLSLMFPKFRFDLENATVFCDVTKEKPPHSFLKEGMMVVWNDRYLPKDHPARKHCGEGPFRVIWDDDYIVSVSKNSVHFETKPRNHRVILKCPDENFLISVYEGYLKPKYRRVISTKEWYAYTRVRFTHIRE